MNTIDVLVIEPLKTPECRAVPDTLEALQGIVGGYIERIPLADDVNVYCDEEGKLKLLTPNRALRFDEQGTCVRRGRTADVIMGTFVITGRDQGTGRNASLDERQVEHWEHVFHDPEAPYRTPSGRTGMTPIHSL